MPRAGPRKAQRYSLEFKSKAVKLSQLKGVEVQAVADALQIRSCCRGGERKPETACCGVAYMERWSELADLTILLLKRYPGDPAVLLDASDFLKAHGSWPAALAVARKAKRSLRSGRFTSFGLPTAVLAEGILMTEVECLYELDRRQMARRVADQALKRSSRMRILRAVNRQVRDGVLKIEPWAPKRASYLDRIRKAAT